MTTTPPEPEQPFGAGQPAYPGAQQPPAAPYGSYPTGPGGLPPQAPAAPPQPSSIALAVKLMWAGATVSLISLVVSLAGVGSLKDDIAQRLREDDSTVSQSTIDAAFALGIVFAIVIGGLGVVAWLWMAWKNGQGRGWARVVATVLGALNVLFTLLSFTAEGAEPLAIVFSLINLVLAVIILVLLWRKESTEFYNGTAASRRMY